MKVAMINLGVASEGGGGFITQHSIHKALLANGVDSTLYVGMPPVPERGVYAACASPICFPRSLNILHMCVWGKSMIGGFLSMVLKSRKGPVEIMRWCVDNVVYLIFKLYVWPRLDENYSIQPCMISYGSRFSFRKLNLGEVDVVHLGWWGFLLSLEDLLRFRDMPLVWTLHDSWAFLGVEHWAYDNSNLVDRYFLDSASGQEPQRQVLLDVPLWVWRRKRKVYASLKNLHLVCPSAWMKSEVERSILLHDKKVSVIPNPVNTDIFRPMDKTKLRKQSKYSVYKKCIGFAVASPVQLKGTDTFLQLVAKLKRSSIASNISLAFTSFGLEVPEYLLSGIEAHVYEKPMPNEEMPLFYNKLDLFLMLSIKENFPTVVLESMACGVPVVSFPTGGSGESIDHKVNGYVTESYDIDEIIAGILWVLEDEGRYQRLSEQARAKTLREYSFPCIAQKYHDLYKSMI